MTRSIGAWSSRVTNHIWNRSGQWCPSRWSILIRKSRRPKDTFLASWYFAIRSTGVLGTGEGETEEVFKGVVVGVCCSSTLTGAWIIVGGGGGTTVAEVDDLEITSCDIGDFVLPSPYLN